MIRIAEGLITQDISDPAQRATALNIVGRAVDHKECLEQRFIDDELTLAEPWEFAELRSLTTCLIQALAISGAFNDKAHLGFLVSVLQMQLFAAVSMRLYS